MPRDRARDRPLDPPLVDDDEPAPLPFLADRDAFLRRFLMSIALEPPPSLRRLRAVAARRRR